VLPCGLAALVALGCARHVVVEPEVVVNRKDPDWTIRQEPEFRPTFAGRERISLPSGSFCDPGVKLSQNAIALYVEPSAEAAGLRAGDRIASVDGRRVRDRADFRTRLGRHRPGQALEVTVERDGASRRVALRCADGRRYAEAIAAMQTAADSRRWLECVESSVAAGRLRVRSADLVAWQAYCEAERLKAAGTPTTPELADLVHETLRLTLLESRYDRSGAEQARAYVERNITWLRQQGFVDRAADLRARLGPRSSSRLSPEAARAPA
jgi:hypothetical protein